MWSGDGMLCFSTPAFSAFGALVSLKRVAWARPFATAFAVNGNAIAVTDSINTEPFPPPGGPQPQCVSTSAALGTLAPGDYIVNWYVVDIGARNIPELLGTYPFTVLRPRSRAASPSQIARCQGGAWMAQARTTDQEHVYGTVDSPKDVRKINRQIRQLAPPQA